MWKIFFRGVRESFGRCGERAVGSACEGNTTFTANPRPGKEGAKANDNSNSDSTSNLCSEAVCSQSLLRGLGLSTVVWLTGIARDWHHWQRHTPAETNFLKDGSEKHNKCRYKCLLQVMAGIAKTQPKLPQESGNEVSIDSESSLGSILSSVTREEQVGVIHSKEVDEAREGLGAISSNVENVLGVYYYDHYQPEQAIKNFQKAWSRGNVKACYNLGLCYELGVGTEPDPAKAADYYKQATKLGHVQAAYNLGVYYAQGRGGLPKDPLMAHRLFQQAANKGLLQAKAAISAAEPLETHPESHKSSNLLSVAVGT